MIKNIVATRDGNREQVLKESRLPVFRGIVTNDPVYRFC